MRKADLMLAVAICAASPFALAQTRDSSLQSDAVATSDPAADAGTDPVAASKEPKSAFGQVMAVLTHLLQEAATQQAAGTAPDDPSSDHSALTITVTPIEGRTTFTVGDTGKAAADAAASPDVEVDGAQLAVKGEEGAG